jgi:hypothetical protein
MCEALRVTPLWPLVDECGYTHAVTGHSLNLAHLFGGLGIGHVMCFHGHTTDRYPSFSTQLTSFGSSLLSMTLMNGIARADQTLSGFGHVTALTSSWFNQNVIPCAKHDLSLQALALCTRLTQLARTNEKLVALQALPNPLFNLFLITRYERTRLLISKCFLIILQIYFKNQTPALGTSHPTHLPLRHVLELVIDSFTSATERHIEVREMVCTRASH